MFHAPRYRAPRPTLFQRLWEWHDDHPLPPKLNRAARHLLYLQRRLKHGLNAVRYPARESDMPGPVPRDRFLRARTFAPMTLEAASARFEAVHQANEAVYRGDGSWSPQPYSQYSGNGVPIEEMALRIPGYLAAYRATDRDDYLARATSAGEYILRERLFADGHLLLQGHIVIDFTYAIAGNALLALWVHDRSRTDFFAAACKIGDRLAEHHIAGSVNHAGHPAHLLSQLYRYTGDQKYLRQALARVFRGMVPFQLPAGDWAGHEARVWYQGVNLQTLISTYVSTPFDLPYIPLKDRLAAAITAATNWFLALQDETGAFPITRYELLGVGGTDAVEAAREVVRFENGRFRQDPIDRGEGMIARRYLGHGAYEIDALVSMYEALDVSEVLPALHGYAALIAGTGRLWRLEFNTLGAGRYLGLLSDLAARPPAIQAGPASRRQGFTRRGGEATR